MSKFEREIIKEFLEAIIPDKTNRLFIRTKTCPLGIWITGKQIKAKLKDSLEKVLHSQNQELLEKIEERIELRLKYCREQNGLPYCKNCGLCKEDLEDIKKLIK